MSNKNLIVTHSNPDLDAVSAIWLLKRFITGWADAELAFVPAGETYKDDKTNRHIVHVDTGMGDFDHHQDNRDTCAAKLILSYMVGQREGGEPQGELGPVSHFKQEALSRLVAVIND